LKGVVSMFKDTWHIKYIDRNGRVCLATTSAYYRSDAINQVYYDKDLQVTEILDSYTKYTAQMYKLAPY
jgi:hypothetical protein